MAAPCTSAAGVYRPLRAVRIAGVVQRPHAPVRFVIAFELAAGAGDQHLFVSYKIWDARGGVVYYTGASTRSTLESDHRVVLRWNRRGFDRLPVPRDRRYVVRPFVAAYPAVDPGNTLQLIGGRAISFILRAADA